MQVACDILPACRKKGVGFMDDDVNVRRILIQICTKNDDWAVVIFIVSLETEVVKWRHLQGSWMDGGKKKLCL